MSQFKHPGKNKNSAAVIAVLCLAVAVGGAYFLWTDTSDGLKPDQFSHYKNDLSVNVGFKPTEVQFSSDNEIPGLFVTLGDYNTSAGTSAVTVEGFLFSSGEFTGIIVFAGEDEASYEYTFSIDVAENSTNLTIMAASVIGLIVGLYMLIVYYRGRH
ncbi:MAG: hypothetical protein LBJ20_02830 [Candidatus Methanoplasma sp.]|jgi:hypothetical protein|nr:hypothetical protein [Candidatus Methanoplasma sp.]